MLACCSLACCTHTCLRPSIGRASFAASFAHFCSLKHILARRQDASWRELIKFCAARGAYRGAGSGHMQALLRGGGDVDDGGRLFGAGEHRKPKP